MVDKNECRSCGHKHWMEVRRFIGVVKIEDVCGNHYIEIPLPKWGESGIVHECNCKRFIPLDNLAFLEYKIKEGEKV